MRAKRAGVVSEYAASLPEKAQPFSGPRLVPNRENGDFFGGIHFVLMRNDLSFSKTLRIFLPRLRSIGDIESVEVGVSSCRAIERVCAFRMPYKDPKLLLKPNRSALWSKPSCRKKLRPMKTLQISTCSCVVFRTFERWKTRA